MLPSDRKLTGRRCQCGGCGEYFNSLGAFEKHRVGFRCLTVGQMTEKGMIVSKLGWWISSQGREWPVRGRGNDLESISEQGPVG